MSNMSYCRFRNTLSDLTDCKDALESVIEGDVVLSDEELEAAKKMVQTCAHIIDLILESGPAPLEISINEIVEDVDNQYIGTILNEYNEGGQINDYSEGGQNES